MVEDDEGGEDWDGVYGGGGPSGVALGIATGEGETVRGGVEMGVVSTSSVIRQLCYTLAQAAHLLPHAAPRAPARPDPCGPPARSPPHRQCPVRSRTLAPDPVHRQ